jgi:hypothetical protein
MTSPISDTVIGTADPRTGQVVWNRPADKLRDAAETAYARIRSARALSDYAKRAMVASVYLKLKEDMDAAQSKAGIATAADLALLKRKLYGVDDLIRGASNAEQATLQISFRDAQSRAESIGNERDARTLLDRANQTGDELLARAVGNQLVTLACAGIPVGNTLDEYLSTRPQKATAYAAYVAACQPTSMASLFEYAAPSPPEVHGLTQGQMDTMIAEAKALAAESAAADATWYSQRAAETSRPGM